MWLLYVPGAVVNEQGEGGGVVEQPICGAQGGSMTISTEIIGPLFDGNDKVAIALARIRQFTPPEGLYVAFSGGKDSVVLLDLVRKAGVKHDTHYNLTTVDPPELVHFIRKEYPSVQVHRPAMSMWQLIVKKKLPPTRMVRYCCEVLKERGGDQGERTVTTGVRWSESAGRRKRWRGMVQNCRNIVGKVYLMPIIDWTDEDIWQHIRANKLPYCSLYDEGFKRLGCVMCPMTGPKHIQMEMERWPKIAEAYKRAILKSWEVNKLGDHVGGKWKSGEDMWNWWIGAMPSEEEDDSTPWLFE
jgi:phosphoadenosine phosphosulfate reductase